MIPPRDLFQLELDNLLLYSFALGSPAGHKIFETSRKLFFKKINESVPSHLTFYLEVDDHKLVDFKGEMINFTCQLTKK